MTESDRELLEMAAKAAGIDAVREFTFECDGSSSGECKHGLWNRDHGGIWNPLTDDGDALRLAVKLKMEILFFDGFEEIHANSNGSEGEAIEGYQGDMAAATRRAITRCAAFIGDKK